MNLSSADKKKLLTEGGVAIILLLLVDWAIISLTVAIATGNFKFGRNGLQISSNVQITGSNLGPSDLAWWGILVLIVASVFFLIWWFLRAMQQLQVYRLLEEIRYITNQNPEHEINWNTPTTPVMREITEGLNKMNSKQRNVLEEEREHERIQKEMVTNISHDLRTPLTSIIGYLDLIETNPAPMEEPEMRKYVHTAYSKAVEMHSLVEGLSAYTSSELEDTKTMNNSDFDLGQLFEQITADFELQAEDNDIVISQNTNPKEIKMFADAEKIARVISNLINNGIKYGKTARFIKLTAQQIGDNVVIRVANDGEEIPKSEQTRIFERSYRVDKSGNKKISGSGLGLSIVKNFVEVHHGTITVESDKNITQFVIKMPLDQNKMEASA